jgi:hypothetical protein
LGTVVVCRADRQSSAALALVRLFDRRAACLPVPLSRERAVWQCRRDALLPLPPDTTQGGERPSMRHHAACSARDPAPDSAGIARRVIWCGHRSGKGRTPAPRGCTGPRPNRQSACLFPALARAGERGCAPRRCGRWLDAPVEPRASAGRRIEAQRHGAVGLTVG